MRYNHIMKSLLKKLTDSIPLTETLDIKRRTYLSTRHIYAAAMSTRESELIEKNYDGNFTEEIYFRDIAFVLNAITSSVSFLEATVNEFLTDTVEHDTGELVGELDTKIKGNLALLWKKDILRLTGTLDKYNLILSFANKKPFEKGSTTYQKVDDLIKLRNALVHYKPEWVGDEPHKFEQRLKKYQFDINVIMKSPGNAFFPQQCLGHGCAKWALQSSIKFVEEFYNKLGYKYPFGNIIPHYE